jgi:hypothetical protein
VSRVVAPSPDDLHDDRHDDLHGDLHDGPLNGSIR